MKFSALIGATALVTGALAQQEHVMMGYMGDDNGSRNLNLAARVPQRLPIEKVMTDPDTMGMLVVCFDVMMKEPANSLRGYCQVAGQHGLPYIGWDNDPRVGGTAGYCAHGSTIFCDVHRPMIRLMELRMIQWCYLIARWYCDSWEQQAVIYRVCDKLALPYWDWAALTYVPSIFTASRITIRHPVNGSATAMNNPFTGFSFPQSGSGASNYNNFARPDGNGRLTRTYRDSNWVNQVLDYQPTLKTQVNQYLSTRNAPFANMCTSNSGAWSGQGSSIPSLESMHNTVHSCIGGVMNSIDLSSYDPIFWLHHCNVDRLYNLYQEINTNVVMNSGTVGSNTWSIRSSTSCNQDLQFRPYYRDWQGQKPFTPRLTRYTENMNYTYDCVQNYRGNYNSYIAQTYGGSATSRSNKRRMAKRALLGARANNKNNGHGNGNGNGNDRNNRGQGGASTPGNNGKGKGNGFGRMKKIPPPKFNAKGCNLVAEPPASVVDSIDDLITPEGKTYLFFIHSSCPKRCAKRGAALNFFLQQQNSTGRANSLGDTTKQPGWCGGHGMTAYMENMADAEANAILPIQNAIIQARALESSHLNSTDLDAVTGFVAYNGNVTAYDSVTKEDITQSMLACGWVYKLVYLEDTAHTPDTVYGEPKELLDFSKRSDVAAKAAAFAANFAIEVPTNVTNTTVDALDTAANNATTAATDLLASQGSADPGTGDASPATTDSDATSGSTNPNGRTTQPGNGPSTDNTNNHSNNGPSSGSAGPEVQRGQSGGGDGGEAAPGGNNQGASGGGSKHRRRSTSGSSM